MDYWGLLLDDKYKEVRKAGLDRGHSWPALLLQLRLLPILWRVLELGQTFSIAPN